MSLTTIVKTEPAITYDAACRAIAEAHRVDDVKDWHDKVAAMQEYARQAQNYDLEKQAYEIRKRAERRMGELLKDMKKEGTRSEVGKNKHSKDHVMRDDMITTLSDMGITRNQSSQYQALANVPKDEFEAALKESTSGPKVVPLKITRITKKEKVRPPQTAITASMTWYSTLYFIDKTTPQAFYDLLTLSERSKLPNNIAKLTTWLKELENAK